MGRGWVAIVGLVVIVGGLLVPARAPASAFTVERIAGPTRVETAVEVARRVHETATVAVLTRSGRHPDALAGAPLAARLGGPILLTAADHLPGAVTTELERLDVDEIVLLGGPAALGGGVEQAASAIAPVTRIGGDDRYATAAAVASRFPPGGPLLLATGADFPDALAAGPLAAHLGRPILLTPPDHLPGMVAAEIDRLEPDEVLVLGGPAAIGAAVVDAVAARVPTVRRLAGATRYATAAAIWDESRARGLDGGQPWVASGGDFPDALAAGPAVGRTGGTLVLVDGVCLARSPETTERLRTALASAATVRLLGGPSALSTTLLDQLAGHPCPPELPRGGRSILPEHRLVAFYGTANIPAMGVLGEGTPDEAAGRLAAQAAPYDSPARPILPVFEFIATIATRGAGPDGDYSAPVAHSEIQRYLDAARRHGTYVLLDLQPGRSDFLTQARTLEHFLRQPDVGLALDPEWRMGPGEVPAETIGSVDAAEINAVMDYVAGLVREEDLPEKLFVVHQFRSDMVTNRHLVQHPPELAMTFHIDGFGTRSAKLNTYGILAITDGRWWNGLKLFYDEDVAMWSPAEALSLTPQPDLISYQ